MLTFVSVKEIKVDIIGSGNVASHLASIFMFHKIKVCNIYSRNFDNAKEIALKNNIQQASNIEKIGLESDIIFLAVADDAIEKISKLLIVEDAIIVHCSGIANTEVLKARSKNYGCFYPLQTFTKNHPVDFSQIPVLITGSNETTVNTLKNLANLISLKVEVITDVQRQKLHLAAVIVNNFTNHLFTLSSNYLAKNEINFDLLKPLIQETVNKISVKKPKENQTGPAKRNDTSTIEKHFSLIEDEDLKEIYKILTKSIFDTHNG